MMTSRTFPLSRQRRRRINKPPLVPTQDGQRYAEPATAGGELGDALERQPGRERDAAGQPLDEATHRAGARPAGPRLPHERDLNADKPQPPRPVMRQANEDIEAGLEDTDCRGNAAAQVFPDRGKNRNCP
ncbi:MAG: hypothetical protein IT508_11845 [Burkholderiaceae bacterium]|nr:hypothetical protein [Burkholderiaceae bacterium]